MIGNWEVVDGGYARKSRLVDVATGKIIGTVSGCGYGPREEWGAFDEDGCRIGLYVTEGQAKKAVDDKIRRNALETAECGVLRS